ncbi:MAG: GntR family transcriptional regulator [Rhodospirillales bacterium]|nr:GntR family transcriptional regulator [Rhodospirillales bacterium]
MTIPAGGLNVRGQRASSPPRLQVQPLDTSVSFRNMAYERLKKAITEMDIYDHPEEIRLDERQLSEDLAVSRTPVREAITLLEQEGFVRSVPRRGVFVVKKTKTEILEMITVWAALESMSARLAAQHATDLELRRLRALFSEFENEKPTDHISEYSDANIAFHQTIIRLGGCKLIAEMTENLFIHMRAIRKITIRQDNRAERSIIDHMNIIEALVARDADRAERLVREHTFGLRAHVEKHGDFLG